jgi:threonine/homoserine/homoserine lactone efflux protein
VQFVVAFLLGVGIAFVGSIPIAGPLAVLVVDRAVGGRREEGMFIALGGALAEAGYALAVAILFPILFGLSHGVLLVSRIAGAVLVAIAGAVLLVHPGVVHGASTRRKSGSFLTGLALSALNPTLLATWTVVVATLNAHGLLGRSVGEAALFAVGVGGGVTAWFAVLVSLSRAAEDFLNGRRRVQTIRTLGFVLVCVGCYFVFRAVRGEHRDQVRAAATDEMRGETHVAKRHESEHAAA